MTMTVGEYFDAQRRTIRELNLAAWTHQVHDRSDPYDALMAVVRDRGLVEVARSGNDQCRIYRTPEGVAVNCWIEAPMPVLHDGGMGFDDQTEWLNDD